MDNSLVIVHFQPVEKYPPAMNLVEFICRKRNLAITLVTTFVEPRNKSFYGKNNPLIVVKRYGSISSKYSKIRRLLNYLRFQVDTILLLIIRRPDTVMYFETISSFPVFFYKKFINRSARIFIHYHEYTSPEEYNSGMALVKLFHRFEKYLYSRAVWISHTNQFRLKLFELDEGLAADNLRLMPNYPPSSWWSSPRLIQGHPVKVVYVGALDLNTMYLRDFVNWIEEQNGQYIFDLYSDNYSEQTFEFITSVDSEYINFKGALNYNDLPGVLKKYDLGVILYKGHIPNYVYNAPNKLFEYLACGLDVWFPKEMEGCYPYTSGAGEVPVIASIDFKNLENLSISSNASRNVVSSEKYFAEEVYEKIYFELMLYKNA